MTGYEEKSTHTLSCEGEQRKRNIPSIFLGRLVPKLKVHAALFHLHSITSVDYPELLNETEKNEVR